MNTDKITAEEMVIIDRLKQMKMSGMAEAYEEQLLNPNIDLTSFFTRFSNIVNFEWELRFNKKFNRFLKKATLRYPQASFDDTIYEPDRQLDTAPLNSWLPVNGWTKEETFLLQEPQEPENLIYQMHCVLLPLGSSRQLSISGQTP